MQLPRLQGPHTIALCGHLWQLRGTCPSEGWWAVLVHSQMASARMGKTDSLDGDQTLGGSQEESVFSPFDENASQELFTLGKDAFEKDSGEDTVPQWGLGDTALPWGSQSLGQYGGVLRTVEASLSRVTRVRPARSEPRGAPWLSAPPLLPAGPGGGASFLSESPLSCWEVVLLPCYTVVVRWPAIPEGQ